MPRTSARAVYDLHRTPHAASNLPEGIPMPPGVDAQRPGHEPSDLEKHLETINAQQDKLTQFTPDDIIRATQQDRDDH